MCKKHSSTRMQVHEVLHVHWLSRTPIDSLALVPFYSQCFRKAVFPPHRRAPREQTVSFAPLFVCYKVPYGKDDKLVIATGSQVWLSTADLGTAHSAAPTRRVVPNNKAHKGRCSAAKSVFWPLDTGT
jgi:hypothetical protein